MQMKVFHMVTEGCNGKNVEIDYTEYEILQLVNLCLKRRYNKHLRLKFAKFYIEAKGKDGEVNLLSIGLEPKEIHQGYEEMKKIVGELH